MTGAFGAKWEAHCSGPKTLRSDSATQSSALTQLGEPCRMEQSVRGLLQQHWPPRTADSAAASPGDEP